MSEWQPCSQSLAPLSFGDAGVFSCPGTEQTWHHANLALGRAGTAAD